MTSPLVVKNRQTGRGGRVVMLTDVNIIRDALKQKAPSFVQGGIYPSLGFWLGVVSVIVCLH